MEQKSSWPAAVRWLCCSCLLGGLASGTPESAEGLTGDAERLARSGQAVEARRLFERALGSAARGTELRGKVLAGLSSAATAMGDYRAAAQSAEEAAQIYHELRQPRAEASVRNSLGLSHLYAGDYLQAENAFQEAVALSRLAGTTEGEAEQLSNLANVYYFQGRYTEALDTYGRAREATRKAEGAPWAARRNLLLDINEAALMMRLGQNDAALAIYRRLEKAEEMLRPAEYAQLKTNLGVLYRRLGDPILALESYQQAQEIFHRHHHRDGEIGTLKNQGIVQALDLGELDQAHRIFERARTHAEASGNQREALHARLYLGEVLYRAGRLAEAREHFTHAAAQSSELGTVEERWKTLYGLGRVALREGDHVRAAAMFRDAIVQIERVREKLQVTALRSDFFADKREVYDALIAVRLAQSAPTSELFDWMERSRARTLQDSLTGGKASSLEVVQAGLTGSTLLLEYWVSTRGSALLWVTADDSGVAAIDWNPAEALRFIDQLASGAADWRTTAIQLGRSLLPARVPADRTQVVLIPDGPAALIPFEALDWRGDLVVSKASVTYLPAAALLLRPSASRSLMRPMPWDQQIAAYADPIPGAARLAETGAPAERLRRAAGEVTGVAALWGGRSSLHAGAGNRKAALLESVQRKYPILHLATHAWTDVESPDRSRLLFSPASGSDNTDYLFLPELYDLRMGAVRLVVLSACETGRGKTVRGEGVQSFSRALLSAGVETAVTTLWRIEDSASADLMKQFYFHLKAGATRAEALQRAKQRLLGSGTSWSHPRYWAAFVLTGNGWSQMRAPLSWLWLVVLGTAGMTVLVVGVNSVKARRRRVYSAARRASVQ